MRRLIVVRHGRTAWNATNRFQGQADIPLDEIGQAQAAAMAKVVGAEQPSTIWSSDLSRAQATAQAIADVVGVPIRTDPVFREIFTGDWEGLTGQQVQQRWPAEWERWHAGQDIVRSGGAETREQVGRRFGDALSRVAEAIDDERCTVVVGHGTAIRAGICQFVGYAPGSEWLFGSLHNCHWVLLAARGAAAEAVAAPIGRGWRVAGYNLGVDLR